jgi:hypothetical protein
VKTTYQIKYVQRPFRDPDSVAVVGRWSLLEGNLISTNDLYLFLSNFGKSFVNQVASFLMVQGYGIGLG